MLLSLRYVDVSICQFCNEVLYYGGCSACDEQSGRHAGNGEHYSPYGIVAFKLMILVPPVTTSSTFGDLSSDGEDDAVRNRVCEVSGRPRFSLMKLCDMPQLRERVVRYGKLFGEPWEVGYYGMARDLLTGYDMDRYLQAKQAEVELMNGMATIGGSSPKDFSMLAIMFPAWVTVVRWLYGPACRGVSVITEAAKSLQDVVRTDVHHLWLRDNGKEYTDVYWGSLRRLTEAVERCWSCALVFRANCCELTDSGLFQDVSVTGFTIHADVQSEDGCGGFEYAGGCGVTLSEVSPSSFNSSFS